MCIFPRGNKATNPVPPHQPDPTGPDGAADPGSDAQASEPHSSGHPDAAEAGDEKRGPFDRSEVVGLDGRLDLGSMWVTGVPGMELRLEVEQESQNVVGGPPGEGASGGAWTPGTFSRRTARC